VVAFLHVRELVHDDHAQPGGRHGLEQVRDADLLLGLELAALHARHGGVGAQRMADHVQLAVEDHLRQRAGLAHELVLEAGRVEVERLVGLHGMRALGVALAQPGAQALFVEQPAHLRLQRRRIGREVLHARWRDRWRDR